MNGKTKKLLGGGISLAFVITLAIGYGGVKGDVKNTKTDIVEIKGKVNKNTEEIDQEENINIQQAETMKQLQQGQIRFLQLFDKVNDRMDKALAR